MSVTRPRAQRLKSVPALDDDQPANRRSAARRTRSATASAPSAAAIAVIGTSSASGMPRGMWSMMALMSMAPSPGGRRSARPA